MPKINLREFARSESNLYIVILACLGMLLVFLIPPFQSPDEQTHLYRAYQLSEGHLVGERLSYGAGDHLPASLSNSFDRYSYLLFNTNAKVTGPVYRSSLDTPLNTHQQKETHFENTAIYPPLAYTPQVVGVGVGRIFSANPIIMLYLARLMNLAAWLAILWFAMKRNKRIALPLFAFAMLPIVAFQAASASADVLTAGAAIFFTLEVFRLASRRSITKNDLMVLATSAAILALCKFPYVILTGLVLLLPNAAFASKQLAWKFKAALLGGSAIISLAWTLIAQKTFVNLRAGIDTGSQLHFILNHPFSYIGTLYDTFVSLPSDNLYIQLVGQLGWLDTKMPLWSIFFGSFAVVLAALAIPSERSKFEWHWPQRSWTALLAVTTTLAIASLLYLTYTSIGADFIDGLQGRYFIPLGGALIIAIGGLLGLQKEQFYKARNIVYFMSGATMVSTLTVIVLRYYS